ncbi:tetraspanin-1-like [Silurus meridionalis]|uniref:tetraspanin-1-like n=1 Tax=Silurus meridionalis TaxID=175797 RepID=UPI001EE9C22F|nr:tetraspanin-1-like [Silurus meridionalis]
MEDNTAVPEELPLLTKAGYLMIAIGGALTFVGFLGCYGAYYENKYLLNIVERHWEIYSIIVAEKIKKTYNQDNFNTKLWNETMTLMECCGLNNYTDFTDSEFVRKTSLYPNFCCPDKQSQGCKLNSAKSAGVTGCFKAVVKWVASKATLLGGMAVSVAVIQVAVIIASRKLSNS